MKLNVQKMLLDIIAIAKKSYVFISLLQDHITSLILNIFKSFEINIHEVFIRKSKL